MRDAMLDSQDRRKEQSDAKVRGCIESYQVEYQILLNAKSISINEVSAVFEAKLHSRFIEPSTIVANKDVAYTLNLLRKLRTHPVFYVGML